MNTNIASIKRRSAIRYSLTAFTGLILAFAALPAWARDTVADEFNTLAAQIQSPPSASWMHYAYSSNSMPIATDRDPVDVLLRRTTAVLNEFNQGGLLDSLAEKVAALQVRNAQVSVSSTAARLQLFRDVSDVSRKVAFANPLLNFKDIVFLKRQFATYNHMCDSYFGFNQVAGGGIYVLQDAFSDNPVLRDVLTNAICENGRFMGQKLNFGSFLSPSLSYDGKTIYFSHTETGGPYEVWTEHTTFHIFKVNVDGTGLRQLTDGPVNDLFPYPLPNGRIVFVSERRGGYGRCHARPVPTYTLYSMNADGTDITELSAHETNEWQPSVDNNGMIVYTRWDYVDRGDDQSHHPWITYPDGRDARAIQGVWKPYGSASPYMEQDVRPIPGSNKYVSTAAPHHGQTFGSFVLIDPQVADDGMMSPLKVLTPEAQFPEATTGATTDWKFATAWALSERFYLCGYDPTCQTLALTLLDAKTGLKTVIYHDPNINCTHPIPLIPRAVPPIIPNRAASGLPLAPGQTFDPSVYNNMPTNGTLAVMNVYDTTLPFPPGTVIKYLRIIEVLPKTVYDHVTPHLGYAQEKPARRVLGTVPVEKDGSAYFTLHADTPVFFQALDANQEAVQSMRSLTYIKPGESLTCMGCHEPKGSTVPPSSAQPIAVQRGPSTITPDVAGSNPFSYPRLVQPVLDASCVSCHQAQGALDLSAGNYVNNFNYWYNSYLNLAGYAFYYGAYANDGYDTWNTPVSIPGQFGAKASLLYQQVLTTNHYGLQLSTNDLHRLTLWLDCNSDFFGADENTLAQSQGQIVQPIDPRITGYQTVTNTVYGPAIPPVTTPVMGNNNGLSLYGTPLQLAAPQAGGLSSMPVILGQPSVGSTVVAVDAGQDKLASAGGPAVFLAGSVTVNGQLPISGSVQYTWSQVAGPTNATFGNPSHLATTATFSQPGSYQLRLTAATATTTNSDDMVVTVMPSNQAPLVFAGPDLVLRGQTNVALDGRVLDDSGVVTSTWSRYSGPGTVTFDSPNSPTSTARFSATGTYVLRLVASDGVLSASDTCSVQVLSAGINNPPTVSAGNDISTSYTNNPIQLQGSASDDGIPGPLTTTWSVISGPGTVTFGNPYSPATTANFSQFGFYLLQLTATDGDRTAYDQLAVYLFPGDGSMQFGSITREYWGGIAGTAVANLTSYTNYPNHPESTTTLTSFQVPNNSGDNYGSRVHGYLVAPVTGYYTFWLASDDGGELWLSTSTNQNNAVLIASVATWTDPLQWDTFPSQKSASILLQAGQVYYIKALQKDGTGGDHVAVAWQGPGFTRTVIDGMYLAPIPNPLPARGTISREYWLGLSGNAISDLTSSPNYPNNPSGVQTLTTFEGPSNWADAYGARVRGFLYPPASGTYTFWIASDDNSQLWLSTNSRPENASLIASVAAWTNPRQWTLYPSQQSAPVSLQSNQIYYIMALHKEGAGADSLAVAWQGPGIAQSVIPGQYLSSYADVGVWSPPSSGGPVVLGQNERPRVDAGPYQEISFQSNLAVLHGRAVDDGLPANPGTLAVQWSMQSGPGTVTFSNSAAACTFASFSAPGLYLLRFDANDGELSDSATVAVTVTDYSEYGFFYPSPQDLVFSPDGSMIAVADEGLNRVLLMNPATRTILKTIPVQGTPRGLAWETTNSLWVCEYDAASLANVDAAQGRVVRRLAAGPKPYDVKVDSSRGRLVAVDFGLAQVSILDLASGRTLTNLPAVDQPMYLTLTPDRSKALVANSQPKGDARGAAYAPSVTVVDLIGFGTSQIQLPPGSTSLRGIAVSPDGRWAYVAHLLGRTYLPTTQINHGWMLNNVVSIIDLAAGRVYATLPLDALKDGAANPWGLTLSDNGQTLWVCAAGVNEVIRLNMASIFSYLAANPTNLATIDYDLLTLYQSNWLQRIGPVGTGPRGIALSPDGHTLAVAAYFSGEVHLLDTVSSLVNDAVVTGFSPPEHALRRGERLYNDATGCFERWLSCATCHPGGRADGLNWDLLNDGLGNAKNTMSHLYSTRTPPSMATGIRANAMIAIQAGFKYIEFQQHSDQDMQDVYDYMDSLRPEPSPYLNKGRLTTSALRGKALFQNSAIGCANCHSGTYFTDLQKRNVGTGHPGDIGPYDPVYDTPILHELWRTAPYLHDGSAPTLRDVLTTQNTNNQHGATSQLSSGQIDDLVAYLNQIGGVTNWMNTPPVVDAGKEQLLILPAGTAQLSAVAQDDGLPYGTLTLSWTPQNGPAPVAFGDTNLPATTATFTVPGVYTLGCIADDGELRGTNSVVVIVAAPGTSPDSNSNGIADAWEYHYFGGLTTPNGGANDDFDGDGLSNWYEYVTGTDPTDPSSGFRLYISQPNGQIAVSFHATAAGTVLTPGTRFFTLQRGVPGGNGLVWSNVAGYTDIQGADQDVQWTGTASDAMQLFRVAVRLSP